MPAPSRKNIFLTGASSGIGRAAAELLTQSGHRVWGTSRHLDRLPQSANFQPIAMDLEDAQSISHAWTEALHQAGHIDVVIQNAGAGIFGSIEDVPGDVSGHQWRVLVEGPLQILQLAAAHLRPRRAGLIIGISSLAAEMPIPFSAHYSAGKSAFSALLAGLAMELKPFNVRVVDLRPGDIRTSFIDNVPSQASPGSLYFPWADQTAQKCSKLMAEAPPPDLIACGILRLIEAANPPPVARLGTFFQARLGPLGVRFLPLRFMLNSIRQYYGLHKIDERQRARK